MRRFLYGVLVILLCVVGLSGQPAQAKTRLNKTKLTISVGQKVTLKVKGSRKKAKWSSSNKKVATVSRKGKDGQKRLEKRRLRRRLERRNIVARLR